MKIYFAGVPGGVQKDRERVIPKISWIKKTNILLLSGTRDGDFK